MRSVICQPPLCRSCAQPLREESSYCVACGEAAAAVPLPSRRLPRSDAPSAIPPASGLRSLLFSWGVGGTLAPLLSWGPILGFMGWFLASLIHELGHCAVSWFAGCPAIPAISLSGHAAAAHGTQIPLLCYAIWASLGFGVYALRERGSWPWILAFAALVYPAFAFTSLRQLIFLLAGHVCEIGLAAVFLRRAAGSAGLLSSPTERVLSAALGWHLIARNLLLCRGIIWDESVRSWYETSGSFGLPNDYTRVAHDHLQLRIETVAAGMLVFGLAVLSATLVSSIAEARRLSAEP